MSRPNPPKITDNDLSEITMLVQAGETAENLAERYGYSSARNFRYAVGQLPTMAAEKRSFKDLRRTRVESPEIRFRCSDPRVHALLGPNCHVRARTIVIDYFVRELNLWFWYDPDQHALHTCVDRPNDNAIHVPEQLRETVQRFANARQCPPRLRDRLARLRGHYDRGHLGRVKRGIEPILTMTPRDSLAA